VLVLLTCGVAAGVTAVVWPQRREPEYQGKTLSEWLELTVSVYWSQRPLDMQEEAIGHIGTNALPWLVEWVQCGQPQWERWMTGRVASVPVLGGGVFRILERRKKPAEMGRLGFGFLGPNARSAVPDLVRIANGTRRGAAENAIFALGCVGGDDGFPFLVQLLTNRLAEPWRRCAAADTIGGMGYLGTNLNWAAPLLVRCLDDPNARVARRTAEALGQLGLGEVLVAPALVDIGLSTNSARRVCAIETLGKPGYDNRLVDPGLNLLLRDPDRNVRCAATNALRNHGKGPGDAPLRRETRSGV